MTGWAKAIVPELITATIDSIRTGKTARRFKDFRYTTLGSWSRERRVIGKAERQLGARPIRASLSPRRSGARQVRGISTRRSTARGRYGEPHQASASFDSSSPTAELDGDHAGQPAPAVVRLHGLPYRRADCAVSAWHTPSSPLRPAARSG